MDREIDGLNQKIITSTGFFTRISYRVRHWVAVSQRNHHIHSPFRNLSIDLKNVQYQKAQHINNKQLAIQRERNNVVSSYQFLKSKETVLIGAKGEEVVINALSRLPDEYHVLNDVNLRFDRAIYWRKKNEYIKTCQIDHIVAGPTGFFLLETKNWKASDIELKSEKLIHQMQRSGLALWYFTKDYYRRNEQPKIRNVVISLKGTYSGRRLDKYIDVLTPHQLCDYITRRNTILSKEAVKKFVDIISKSGSYHPRF